MYRAEASLTSTSRIDGSSNRQVGNGSYTSAILKKLHLASLCLINYTSFWLERLYQLRTILWMPLLGLLYYALLKMYICYSKLQLQSLMGTLNTTEPHYIRCVKPNNVFKPAIFENFNIIQQLRCGGVFEAIRINCAGYPTRRTFYEFLHRLGFLALEVLERNYDDNVTCQKILDKKGLRGYQVKEIIP